MGQARQRTRIDAVLPEGFPEWETTNLGGLSKDSQGSSSRHSVKEDVTASKREREKVMAVPFEHFRGAVKGSPFYGQPRSLAEMLTGPSDRQLQSVDLPAGWLVQSWQGWEGWTPRDWQPRMQGWKIHVSATPECAAETLARTTAVCVWFILSCLEQAIKSPKRL